MVPSLCLPELDVPSNVPDMVPSEFRRYLNAVPLLALTKRSSEPLTEMSLRGVSAVEPLKLNSLPARLPSSLMEKLISTLPLREKVSHSCCHGDSATRVLVKLSSASPAMAGLTMKGNETMAARMKPKRPREIRLYIPSSSLFLIVINHSTKNLFF